MPSDIQTFPNVSFFVTSLARKFAPLTYSRRGPAWVLQHIRAHMWFNLAASGASDASDRDQSDK